MLRYSIVMAVHNEADAVGPVCLSLFKVMGGLSAPYEIIVADDGSRDQTLERLRALAAPAPFKIVALDGRQGQSAALQAGLDAARGEILVTLDGDGQNDPEDIPALLGKLAEGYDLVCGWRFDRRDPPAKRLASLAANAARRVLTREGIHDVGCTLRALRPEVARKIYLSRGMHRYFSALAVRFGFRVAEVKVRHHPRISGVSKYGISGRLLEGAADLVALLLLDAGAPMERSPEYRVKEVIEK